MKLCYVADGYSIHTQRWLGAFVARGHEVHLIAPPGAPFAIEGVTAHPLRPGTPKQSLLAWIGEARRVLAQIRPDLLHGHYLTRDGWIAAGTLFRPLVLTAWGSDAYLDPVHWRLGRWATRWSLGRADLVTVDAADLAKRVVELGAPAERVQVVQWGVPTEIFKRDVDTSGLRARLGLEGQPVILSTRTLSPKYQQHLMVQAMPQVLEAVPNAVLVVKYDQYDPAYLEQLRAQIAGLNLENSVRFQGSGEYKDMPAYYALADVFVSIAVSDSTPVSLLEAMACGAAPVVGDLPPIREWIADGQNGLFVSPHDTAALAAAATRLLQSPELRAQFAQVNRRLILQRANSALEMDRMAELYRRVIANRHGKRSTAPVV